MPPHVVCPFDQRGSENQETGSALEMDMDLNLYSKVRENEWVFVHHEIHGDVDESASMC